MRTITLPLNVQPVVGETISASVTGKVVAVRTDPMAPTAEQILVDIEIASVGDDEEDGLGGVIDQYNHRGSFSPMTVQGWGE